MSGDRSSLFTPIMASEYPALYYSSNLLANNAGQQPPNAAPDRPATAHHTKRPTAISVPDRPASASARSAPAASSKYERPAGPQLDRHPPPTSSTSSAPAMPSSSSSSPQSLRGTRKAIVHERDKYVRPKTAGYRRPNAHMLVNNAGSSADLKTKGPAPLQPEFVEDFSEEAFREMFPSPTSSCSSSSGECSDDERLSLEAPVKGRQVAVAVPLPSGTPVPPLNVNSPRQTKRTSRDIGACQLPIPSLPGPRDLVHPEAVWGGLPGTALTAKQAKHIALTTLSPHYAHLGGYGSRSEGDIAHRRRQPLHLQQKADVQPMEWIQKQEERIHRLQDIIQHKNGKIMALNKIVKGQAKKDKKVSSGSPDHSDEISPAHPSSSSAALDTGGHGSHYGSLEVTDDIDDAKWFLQGGARESTGSQKETSSQRPPLADWLSEPRDPKNLGVEDENVRLREEVTDLRTQLVAAREQIRLLEMELEIRNCDLPDSLAVRSHPSFDFEHFATYTNPFSPPVSRSGSSPQTDLKLWLFARVGPMKEGSTEPSHVKAIGKGKLHITLKTLSTTQDEYKEVGFDRVFPHYATHGDVFDEVLALLDNTVRPSGPAALCFIAYGPSGAGKTHLLFGPNLRLEKCAGLVFRAAFALFSAIDAEPDIEAHTVDCCFFTFWDDRFFDLGPPESLEAPALPRRGSAGVLKPLASPFANPNATSRTSSPSPFIANGSTLANQRRFLGRCFSANGNVRPDSVPGANSCKMFRVQSAMHLCDYLTVALEGIPEDHHGSAHVVCEFIVNLRLTNKTQRSFKLQFLDLAPCDVADNEAIPEASKASASATLESLVACLKAFLHGKTLPKYENRFVDVVGEVLSAKGAKAQVFVCCPQTPPSKAAEAVNLVQRVKARPQYTKPRVPCKKAAGEL